MPGRKILQRVGHFRNNLQRTVGNGVRKALNLSVQVRRDRPHAEPFECVDQRVREAVQTITVSYDALALHIIEHFADLLGRKLVVIQKRNELGDGPFKVDVVFPERVVGVDQQGLGGQAYSS